MYLHLLTYKTGSTENVVHRFRPDTPVIIMPKQQNRSFSSHSFAV
jgi:hypothetical protein